MKILKGSKVKIVSGKYKGKTSEVLRTSNNDNYVWVKDVNVVTKHSKANPALKIAGGLIKKESKIHISNLEVLK